MELPGVNININAFAIPCELAQIASSQAIEALLITENDVKVLVPLTPNAPESDMKSSAPSKSTTGL